MIATRLVGEIGPRHGKQRARAVREDEHQVPCAAPMRPAKYGEGVSFERMLPAGHRHPIGKAVEVVMGSMSCVPFDSVDHEWLLRMLAHRIADRRILGLIQGWLRVGVMEGQEWTETVEGTPQGSGISPILANVFLHYALDLWIQQWRTRDARGCVIIVRYCDDFVMGFQYEADARKMLVDLRERLRKFRLALHEDKTRLLEFGKLSTELRVKRGERRPETFNFLGFTHFCARSRDGRFVVKRRTDRKRLTRKIHEIQAEMWRRMHAPVAAQHRWIASVLRGHYAYYGLPSNWHRMAGFRDEVRRRWFRVLRRRSQRRLTWARFDDIQSRLPPLPAPHITQTREALVV